MADGRVFITDRVAGGRTRVGFRCRNRPERSGTSRTTLISIRIRSAGSMAMDPKRRHWSTRAKCTPSALPGRLQCLAPTTEQSRGKSITPPRSANTAPRGKQGDGQRDNGRDCAHWEGAGAPVPLFGYTGSPTLSGDLLVTSVGGKRGGTIVAFDKQSGKVVWKALDENVSYSSPVVANLGGETQIVVMTGPRIVGLSARGRVVTMEPSLPDSIRREHQHARRRAGHGPGDRDGSASDGVTDHSRRWQVVKKSRLDQRDFVELFVEHGSPRRLRLWHERRRRVFLLASCGRQDHVDRRQSRLLFVARGRRQAIVRT